MTSGYNNVNSPAVTGRMQELYKKDISEELIYKRIREIKERREGAGPLSMGAQPIETSPDSSFQVEASVTGDFYDPADAPHTTIVEAEPDSVYQDRGLVAV